MDQRTTELIRRERAAQADLIRYYGDVIGQVQRELKVLLADIEDARLAGVIPTAGWIERQASLERWLEASRQELFVYTQAAVNVTTELQRGHIDQARIDALAPIADTIARVGAGFGVPRAEVIHNLVGRASDGAPLGELFDQAAGAAADEAKRTLITGVIRGHNPRKIARDLDQATKIGLNRSLLIARTESIGAYRETALETYRANRDVVGTWIWTASLDNRTCPVCWAMDGSEHQLDESMSSHPGCRCTPTPRTRSWRDLGIDLPDNRPPIVTGPEKFAQLGEADQLAILGRSKLDAYNSGELSLRDLVQETHHPRWGDGLRERSLDEALAAA